jgi:glycosyltransferase involved in cell wall biosynthesis
MARALLKVCGDDEARKLLIGRGHEQIAGFSWEKTAAETREIYKQVRN